MQLAGYEHISIDPAVCGGRPVINGTRMRVSDVLEMLAGGATVAEICADYPYVSVAAVQSCLAFAAGVADHPVVLAAA